MRRVSRGIIAWLACAILLGFAFWLLPVPAAAATVHIQVGPGGLFFAPSAQSIAVGDTVQWDWSTGGHTVTMTGCTSGTCSDSFGDSTLRSAGAFISHTFTTTGTYAYQCNPHAGSGMVGSV